jgi:hypothetical protein
MNHLDFGPLYYPLARYEQSKEDCPHCGAALYRVAGGVKGLFVIVSVGPDGTYPNEYGQSYGRGILHTEVCRPYAQDQARQAEAVAQVEVEAEPSQDKPQPSNTKTVKDKPKTYSFVEIPRHIAAGKPCKACGVPLYFVPTLGDENMPVSVDVPGAYTPGSIQGRATGRGVAHWETCTDPDSFRPSAEAKKKGKKGKGNGEYVQVGLFEEAA